MWAVYGLYHAKTGKWYVGASKNVGKRLERHGIYRKIPKEDLMPKILEEIEQGNIRALHNRELWWIKEMKRLGEVFNKNVAGYPVSREDLTKYRNILRHPKWVPPARLSKTTKPKTSMKERTAAMEARNRACELAELWSAPCTP